MEEECENYEIEGDAHHDFSHLNDEHPLPSYLSPSSVRREVKKDDDCKFCQRKVQESQFKKHLIQRKKCSFLYMKMHNVKSLDFLIIKLFSCEFCCSRTRLNFKLHLKRNRNCLEKYKEKYKIEDVNKLCEKISNLKRKTFPSRSADVRRSNYLEIKKAKTLAQSLNEFKDKTALGNYRLCCQCRSNFRVYGAKPISTEEELYVRLQLSEKKHLQRFETMFICNKCDKEPNIREEDGFKSILGEKVEDDAIVFYPESENLIVENSEILQKRIKVLFPTALEAISASPKPDKTIQNHVSSFYKIDPVEKADIQNLYQNEIKKYRNESECNFYSGTVNANLVVIDAKQISNVYRITGSTEWFKYSVKCMKERMQQWGRLHITVNIVLPQNCSEVLATCLIQKGIPVTIEKIQLGSGRYKIEHKVHEGHMSCDKCTEDCLKVSVEEYLDKNRLEIDLGNSFVGTYVSSAHEKITSFIGSIIQAPSSGLFSTNYYMFLVFDDKGKASIVGSLWPDQLELMNEQIASEESDCIEEQIVNFVEGNISCTGNPEILRNEFGLSETEAEDLGDLVLNTQLHLCNRESDCNYCESLPLPSIETTVIGPCSKKNQFGAKEFLGIIRSRIRNLELQDMKVKMLVWFESVCEDVEGNINENFNEFTITFLDENIRISLDIDDRFQDYLHKFKDEPYLAAYQYALSCCGQTVGSCIIYKRIWLVDCLIKPYNPLFLNANNYACEVQVVNNTWLFEQFFLPSMSSQKSDSCFLFNHRIMSLEEAMAMSDPLVKKVHTSSKDQFVNAKEIRKTTFKKSEKDDADHELYTLEGVSGTFKMLGNVISRHFDRVNINDGLLLVETALWYDFVGSEKSKEIFDTYSNIEIPKSDTDAICTNEKLPNYILCKNGDVLKKRQERKILHLPDIEDSRDLMYSKCLLYLPIKSEDELKGCRLSEIFKQVNTTGVPAFQVELNEKKAFPKKPLKLTEVDLLDELLAALDAYSDRSDSD